MSFFQAVAGVMRAAAGGSPLVSVFNDTSFCSSPTTTVAGIRFNRDGTIDVRQGCGALSFSQNYLSSGLSATVGDDYEVSLSVTSGQAPSSGAALDTFHPMVGSFTWTWSDTPGSFNSATWTFTIREIADTGNTDNATYIWNTEDGS